MKKLSAPSPTAVTTTPPESFAGQDVEARVSSQPRQDGARTRPRTAASAAHTAEATPQDCAGDLLRETGMHTPGPWEVDDNGEVTAMSGAQIALVSTVDDFPCIEGAGPDYDLARIGAECAANARLIAASPELLEFVRTALRIHGEQWSKTLLTPNAPYITLTEWAEAVLARATGEGR